MNQFDRDFQRTRNEIRNSGRWINRAVALIFALAIVMALATGYAAIKAGCVQSMLLNGVCLSDPTLDGALKKVLGR